MLEDKKALEKLLTNLVARLKVDQATGKNKLSNEAIENLIRSEEVRQEKVLPPKQLEAKLIDFKETVEEGRTNKFARELKNKLNKAGLGRCWSCC